MEPTRNHKIDLMRALAILLVMLAHVYPPATLMNLRTFDVVALFMISGMSYGMGKHRIESYGQYLLKRLKKLLIPTIILILVLYFGSNLLELALHNAPDYTLRDLKYSLALTNKGVHYVWIIKIYLLAAILSPALAAGCAKIKSNVVFSLLTIGLLGVYAAAAQYYVCRIRGTLSERSTIFVEEFLLGCAAFTIVILVGIRAAQRPTFIRYIAGISIGLLAFVLAGIRLGWFWQGATGFCPNAYKYPPSLYYLSYGLAVTAVLYLLLPNRTCRPLEWISRHSFTIYLIHVPAVSLLHRFETSYAHTPLSLWYVKYACVLVYALGAAWVWIRVKTAVRAFLQSRRSPSQAQVEP